MKKKLLIGTVLPALAAAAVVGSGFALWVFNDGVKADATQNPSADITQLVKIGTVEKASDFKIVFDQTDATRPTGFKNDDGIAATGITFDFGNGADVKKYAEYKKPEVELNKGNEGETEQHPVVDEVDDKIGFKFTVELTMPTTLASYVVFSFDNVAMTSSANEGKTTFKAETTTNRKIYWGTETVASTGTSHITAAYAEGKEPDDKDDYAKLHNIISGLEANAITATYTAELVNLTKNN